MHAVQQAPAERPFVILGDALDHYSTWPRPTVIVSDGAYGVAGFPGDPPTHRGLAAWYAPHIAAWSARALPSTTLWFWGTEIGATVHPLLDQHGWEYRTCHVWDKGIAHVAGNANPRTLRKFPVVTEVCVHYVRRVLLDAAGASEKLPLKAWLRHEWERSGLPLRETNEACMVKNAATRKYFTRCHLWYYPPAEAFARIAAYANARGRPEGRPYFSIDGNRPLSGEVGKLAGEVSLRRRHHQCVARARGARSRALQNRRSLRAWQSEAAPIARSHHPSLVGDAVAAWQSGRRCFSAEIAPEYHAVAAARLADVGAQARRVA